MKKMEERRIGIFEYDWSMYSFIKDFAIKFADAGYFVDIFQKNPGTNLIFSNITQFDQYKNIRYFSFTISNSVFNRIFRKINELYGFINSKYLQNVKNILDRKIMQKSSQIALDSKYECFIGVEKKGLIWAGILSQLCGCPLIYYSLELYTEDHPGIQRYSYLRKFEKEYHQLSGATIIQDRLRAKALMKFNEMKSANLLYLPISVKGDIVEERSSYFHNKYRIHKDKKIILYYGLIQNERFSQDLVKIAPNLSDNSILMMHGFGDREYLNYLQSISNMERVIFSLDMVPEEEIINVISSATIGLALYENTSSNDRLAAFSSVKVAYFMRCGIPIIAFSSESFDVLMKVYKCGELIFSIDEIPRKIEKITKDYDRYKEQAFMAYKQYYDLDKNFCKFKCEYDNFIKKHSDLSM